MADDRDLRARLDALKKSSALPPVKPEVDETDELVDRFLRFRSTSPPTDSAQTEHQSSAEDQKTLKELLADVPSADQWKVDHLDEKNIQKLIAEAQGLIPTEEPTDSERSTVPVETNVPADDLEDRKDGRDEDAEADDALQQVLDELDIESEDYAYETTNEKPEPKSEPSKEPSSEQAASDAPATFELPSTPSAEPIAKPDSSAPDEGGDDLVQLPSAPTARPSAMKQGAAQKKSSLKKYTDEEIDSWCIICSDDATVRCVGCDDDLYCANCWKEGHVGPDVGYEERMHRWVKYKRERKPSL